MARANVTMGNDRGSFADRGDDVYETCPEATHALLAHYKLPPTIWEPCCASGAIVAILRAAGHRVLATDINDMGCPNSTTGVDFLTQSRQPVDAIITNPPYRRAAEFAEHALSLCDLVILLLRLSFLEAGNGKSEASKARARVLDGGALATVLVFRNRLPRMHRAGWDGPKSSSTVPYAWFVWNRRRVKRPATVRRITWKPAPPLMCGPEERRRFEIKASGLLNLDPGPLFVSAER